MRVRALNRRACPCSSDYLIMKYILCVGAIIFSTGLATFADSPATNSPPRIYRDKIEPHWFADSAGVSNRFWYRMQLPHDEKEFVLVDAAAGKREAAFDAERLAKALTGLTGKSVDAKKPPFDAITFSSDGKTITLSGENSDWNLNLDNYAVTAGSNKFGDGNRLRANKAIHPSRSSTEETSIRFVNHLAQDVDVFWLDEDAARQPYGSLKPDETREQHTYVGHTWLIAAKNGDVLAVFDAARDSGVAVIAETNALPRTTRREARTDRGGLEKISSPDRRWEVFIRDYNVFLRDTRDGAEQQLTQDGNPDNSYSRNVESDRAVNVDYETRDLDHQTP